MRRIVSVVGLVAVALAAWLTGVASAQGANADLDKRLTDAGRVFHELLATPDRGVPEDLLHRCRCIAVLPHVVKGAFVWGARFGSGVMTCRDSVGAWGPPCFVNLKGGSFGFQIGAQASDVVLFFLSDRGARSLMTGSKFTLGPEAGVAAGPVGRSGEASTDLKLNAEIYSYARAKGLFAGISVSGARFTADTKVNDRYYGRPVTVKQLLFEHQPSPAPASAQDFLKALP